MRIFVYEYVCGGGLAGRPLPESLAREGWAMIASVVEDFARVESCEVVTTLDERLGGRRLAARRIEYLGPDRERATIERLAGACDWTLVIAPEFDSILLDRVRWVEEAGGRLLGPSPTAVAIAADKLRCGRRLQQAGVPAVVGEIVNLTDGLPSSFEYPAVLKPSDGAGSQATFLIPSVASAERVLEQARAEGLRGEALLQPYVPGMAASVSLVIGPAGTWPLQAGQQILTADGRFRYLGGRMPLEPKLARRAVHLGRRAVAAVPGLCGFVGVDLVLAERDQSQNAKRDSRNANPVSGPQSAITNRRSLTAHTSTDDVVIEINPRLTTSYVGLRHLAQANLAERMLRIVAGAKVEPITWKRATICFSPDGTLGDSGRGPPAQKRNQHDRGIEPT